VVLVRQPNKGPGAARNAGLQTATGEFIQFMDSDDLFSKNKLEVQTKKLWQTGADIVFSPWAKIRINENHAIFEDHALQNKMPSVRLPLLNWYLRGWSTVFQTFLIRHSFIKKVGLYREDLMPSEDIEFFVRILLHEPQIVFTDECLTLYRLHDYAKISGAGTIPEKRLIDRGNYLRYTCQNLLAAGYKPDAYSNLSFASEIWGLLQELKNVKTCPPDLVLYLESQCRSWHKLFIKMFLFYLRVLVFARKRMTGSYWRNYYRPGYPTEFQKKLVEDLGYVVQ
jgi:glycosyltransferase involved in cell wall biosynthesis